MPQLTAVTPQHFAHKAWQRRSGYAFAAQANILPVVAAELARLVPALPMGFVQTESSFQLVAITALQPGSNCFLAPGGRWLGDYVPAALRAYPFRLIKPEDREESILCFDESSGLVVERGQGEAFFDEKGAPSQAVKEVLDFLSQMEHSRVATQTGVDALQAAGLIQPWPLKLRQGEQIRPVDGIHRADETALNTLPDDAFLSLRKAGALPLAYAQLLSMNQLAMLQKAAELQTQIRDQLKAQELSQFKNLAGLGFGLSDEGNLKFD